LFFVGVGAVASSGGSAAGFFSVGVLAAGVFAAGFLDEDMILF
jgi:hypothetical protein